MSWKQLGLFLEASLPTLLTPKAKRSRKRIRRAKVSMPCIICRMHGGCTDPKCGGGPRKKPRKKTVSASAPIPKKRSDRYVVLAPGELDDDIGF